MLLPQSLLMCSLRLLWVVTKRHFQDNLQKVSIHTATEMFDIIVQVTWNTVFFFKNMFLETIPMPFNQECTFLMFLSNNPFSRVT